jgi:hypothetical protein
MKLLKLNMAGNRNARGILWSAAGVTFLTVFAPDHSLR